MPHLVRSTAITFVILQTNIFFPYTGILYPICDHPIQCQKIAAFQFNIFYSCFLCLQSKLVLVQYNKIEAQSSVICIHATKFASSLLFGFAPETFYFRLGTFQGTKMEPNRSVVLLITLYCTTDISSSNCLRFLATFRTVRADFKMSIGGILYRGLAKRTSTFVLAIAVSAFVFERGSIGFMVLTLHREIVQMFSIIKRIFSVTLWYAYCVGCKNYERNCRVDLFALLQRHHKRS